MTKKDYKKFAEIIKTHAYWVPPNYICINLNDFLDELSDYLATDNPNFDREKFINACE